MDRYKIDFEIPSIAETQATGYIFAATRKLHGKIWRATFWRLPQPEIRVTCDGNDAPLYCLPKAILNFITRAADTSFTMGLSFQRERESD